MIAYTDFVEGLQKYVESCNTASTERKLALLLFDSTEHCRGYDYDYVSEHASNEWIADVRLSSDQQFHINIIHVQQSQAHAHECFDFIVHKVEH